MYIYILFTVILLSQLFSGYDVGEKISISDQMSTYEYCYPNDSLLNTSFSFSKHNGKVFMIEMSTSWWPSCWDNLQVGDAIHQDWENNPHVEILHVLDDFNQPYSCNQWGGKQPINGSPQLSEPNTPIINGAKDIYFS